MSGSEQAHGVRPWGIALVLLDGTIAEADDVYAAINGVTAAALIGRNIVDFADRDAGYSPMSMMNLILRTRQPLLSLRDYVRPDGTRITCRAQLCPLEDAAGEPSAILVVLQPTA